MQNDDDFLSVLLVSGNLTSRFHLDDSLRAAPDLEVVGEVESFDRASEMLSVLGPVVVVADISSDDRGPEQIHDIRTAHPSVHVVAVAEATDPLFAERVLRAGALGYLANSASSTELLEAVRSVGREKAYVTRPVARKLLAHFMQTAGDDARPDLTPREREVLDLIGFSDVDEVADSLGLSARTVQGYCRNIRRKLGLDTFSSLIEYARRQQAERV